MIIGGFRVLLALSFSLMMGMSISTFVVGYLIASLVLTCIPTPLLASSAPGRGFSLTRLFRFTVNFTVFGYDFLKDLTFSNILIAWDVWTPKDHFKPAIIAVPVKDLDDFELFLLANRIALTPGTLPVDLSEDREVLYVHSMYPSGDGDAISLRRPIDLLRKGLV